ncbi:MAG: hypothetical protein ABIR68_05140 [Ilumatobacteraceae bacterium]
MSWLERYVRGDHVQVWAEMTSLGGQVRAEDSTLAEATAVVTETMRRARQNVVILVDGLQADGYRFEDPTGRPPFEPPPPDVTERLDHLEQRTGPLPLALRGWIELVGRVNLVGSFPDEVYAYSDPLVVDAPLDYVLSEYEQWEQDRGTQWDQGMFAIEIAPDWLHKANVSGGAPYAIDVPERGVDALLRWEPHQTTFVNYLRVAFRWAGFPGWDRGRLDGWAQPTSDPPNTIAHLRALLLLL